MSEQPRRYLSPVDYEAWRNGYMPPSEHILIDQLAYRGARIILSCDSGKPDGPAYWLVVRGKTNPKKVGLAVMRLMADWEDDELAGSAPQSSEAPTPACERSEQGTPATDEPIDSSPQTPFSDGGGEP